MPLILLDLNNIITMYSLRNQTLSVHTWCIACSTITSVDFDNRRQFETGIKHVVVDPFDTLFDSRTYSAYTERVTFIIQSEYADFDLYDVAAGVVGVVVGVISILVVYTG